MRCLLLLEHVLAHAADGADPGVGYLLPGGAGGDAVVGGAPRGVVDAAAGALGDSSGMFIKKLLPSFLFVFDRLRRKGPPSTVWQRGHDPPAIAFSVFADKESLFL